MFGCTAGFSRLPKIVAKFSCLSRRLVFLLLRNRGESMVEHEFCVSAAKPDIV